MSIERAIKSPTSTYKVLEIVGEGTFGVVVKCQRANELAAVKILKQHDANQYLEERILGILSGTEQSAHFVRFFESFSVNEIRLQAFEYVEMTLLHYMRNRNPIPMLEAGPLLFQLLLALKQLEELGIIHADLKPENIMVDQRSNLKIIDFGASHFLHQAMVAPNLCTRWYRAPEIIVGVKYSTSMDMWSFGCIAAEMLIGEVLYQGDNNLEMLWMMSYNHEFPSEFLDSGKNTPVFFEKINGIWKLNDQLENGNILVPRTPGVLFKNLTSIPCKKTDLTQRKKLGNLIMKVLEVSPVYRPSASESIGSDFFNNGNMEQTINYWESIRRTLRTPRTPEGPPPTTPGHLRSRSPIISVG